MKVLINAVRVSHQGGGGTDHYIAHLVNALARQKREFDVFTFAPEHFGDVPADRLLHPLTLAPHARASSARTGSSAPVQPGSFRRRAKAALGDLAKMSWTQKALPFLLKLKGYDLLFSPSQIDALPFCPTDQVMTVLDIIPFVMKGVKAKHEFFLRNIFPIALKNSEAIISISEHTAHDLIRQFGVAPEKITAIPLARPDFGRGLERASEDQVQAVRNRFGEKILFCLSGNLPHKNLTRLLEAFSYVKERVPHRLVIAGYQDPAVQSILVKKAVDSGLKERVVFLGHVKQAELPPLFGAASAFVFPSLYEGFGFPPLEALAYGLPVAVSRSSSLPEVVGDAGIYFDPFNPKVMAEKLLELLTDEPLRRRLADAGSKQAARFTWDRTAAETWAVFERAHAKL